MAAPAPAPAPTTTSTHQQSVVFVLDRLSVTKNLDSDDANPKDPIEAKDVAAFYYQALEPIVNCSLRTSGVLRSVFLNFGPRRLFLGNLMTAVTSLTQQIFEESLAQMYQYGITPNPPDERYFRILDGIGSDLPENRRIIAVVSGKVRARNMISFGNWVANHRESESAVFVIGKRAAGLDIEAEIDYTIKVAEYELSELSCITALIAMLQEKWGI